jgi:hypothetical protein
MCVKLLTESVKTDLRFTDYKHHILIILNFFLSLQIAKIFKEL